MRKLSKFVLVLVAVYLMIFMSALNYSKRDVVYATAVEETSTIVDQLVHKNAQLNEEILKTKLNIEQAKILEVKKYETKVASYVISRGESVGFRNFDLRTLSNLSGEQLDFILRDTALHGLGPAYAKAELDHGVNALFLMGISSLESAWGTSNFAVKRNNLFGYQAYTHDPNKAKYFESKEHCIDFVAQRLKEDYLTSSGPYYGGGYTAFHVNKRYATDPDWGIKVVSRMNLLATRLKSE